VTPLQAAIDSERAAAMPQRAASRLHYRLKDEEAAAIDRHEAAEVTVDALRRDYLCLHFQVVS
jgi:hypothetical protein